MIMRLKSYCTNSCLIISCFCLLSCKEKSELNSNFAINDLLPIYGDTLIAVRNKSGLLITINGGKNWEVLNDKVYFKKIIIDSKKVLWGLDSWIGIHEPSYSTLYYSKDFGKNWKEVKFNTEVFFPINIVSKPFEKLRVITENWKKYELVGDDPNKDWLSIESGDQNDSNNITTGPYKISFAGYLIKENKNVGSKDTLLKLNDISIPFQILLDKDTLFVAGGGYGGYKAYFSSISLSDTILTTYQVLGIQILGIRKDNFDRLWLFGDGGIFLKKNDTILNMYPSITK